MSRVPRIRFKGFEEDWEQRKLGEIADIIGGGTPSTLNLDYWDGNIDWYSPAEIIDQIYVDRSQRKITELGFEKSSAKMLPEGTVLFTSRAGIGKTAILAKKGCTNQGFQSIVPHSNKLDSYFIFSRTEELKKYGELVGAGSTFVEVSGRQMENMQLMIPKTIDEQHIIGVLFSTFDHLITLHQSKSFGHILKAIVSCTLSWEQRKFSELYELVNEKNDGSYGKDSNITVATMQFKSNIQISKNEYLNTYNIFKKGYIAFEGHKSKEFRFGRFVENDIGDGIVSHIFIVFRPIMEFDINFWKYAINNEVIMQSILSRATKASTMMNDLVVKDFLKEIFFLPSLGEQACIGKTLKSIDHLITLHQLEPFQLIFKAIAYRIIDYAKSKPPRHTKYEITISFIKCYVLKLRIYAIYLHIFLENIVYQGYNTVDEKYVYMQNYNIK